METHSNTSQLRPYRRFFPAYALAGVLLLLSFITRLALLLQSGIATQLAFADSLHIFGLGLLFDVIAATYFCLPLALYLALLPDRLIRWRPHRWLFLAMFLAAVYLLCVLAVAEWVFWDEFAARFNFIAVDYLIYTNEVLGNIWESYPVGKLLFLLAVPALFIWLRLAKRLSAALIQPTSWQARLSGVIPWIAAPLLAFTFVVAGMKTLSPLDAINELAGNGIYEFFAAARNNELDYDRFYATVPAVEAARTVRALMPADEQRLPNDAPESLRRAVIHSGTARPWNIVLVSVESLGAEFLGAFGNSEGLTPNLDALATQSLSFTGLFATGNRTVRGMEALALAIPPTPGQSIVKRPNNEGLFSLGSVLEDNGYDTAFIYGGYGYFDNMAYFFSHNDYRVVDRSALAREAIHYENIWGIADEDLYTLALREMDQSHATRAGKPFFMHIMTTSNHRPYTYPAGRIDIPSGTNRAGAVKYSDYAIGEFLLKARSRPWFASTVFVLTADHGASARGTTTIPVEKYRIPLIIYAPAMIQPARIDRLMSQIDIPPTLLGLLNLSYVSKFYGHDVLRTPPADDRAFVANYQTLGFIKAGKLVTLQPQRKMSITALPASLSLDAGKTPVSDADLRREAISFYQNASHVFRNGLYRHEERNQMPVR